jgi:hypothetical protein
MSLTKDAMDIDAAVESATSAVSWGAVAVGATANAALTLVLLSLGVGLGFTVVSPWGAGVSMTTFKIGAGLYLLVVAMIASGVGGHIAGRLRSRWTGVHGDEVFFRDTAHGFLAWAFAAIVGVAALATPAGVIARGASTAASAAAQPAGASSLVDGYVDRLLRSDSGAPANPDAGASRAELSRLLVASARDDGGLKDPDRAYVTKVVASRAGLSEADAGKRVDEVIAQAKSDADKARSAAAQLALWLTASLVLGAFASSLAASEGGRVRERDWTVRR